MHQVKLIASADPWERLIKQVEIDGTVVNVQDVVVRGTGLNAEITLQVPFDNLSFARAERPKEGEEEENDTDR